ncbi:MAG: iron-containing alcohol dehydrogenase, partial [Candidatus Desulfacyla sp.]
GILLPHVMRFNSEEVPQRMADIGAAMGIAVHDMDAFTAAQAAVDKMEVFTKSVGLNQRLRDLGVTEEDLDVCARLSMSDGSIIYNPRMVMDAEEVLGVYRKAY